MSINWDRQGAGNEANNLVITSAKHIKSQSVTFILGIKGLNTGVRAHVYTHTRTYFSLRAHRMTHRFHQCPCLYIPRRRCYCPNTKLGQICQTARTRQARNLDNVSHWHVSAGQALIFWNPNAALKHNILTVWTFETIPCPWNTPLDRHWPPNPVTWAGSCWKHGRFPASVFTCTLFHLTHLRRVKIIFPKLFDPRHVPPRIRPGGHRSRAHRETANLFNKSS